MGNNESGSCGTNMGGKDNSSKNPQQMPGKEGQTRTDKVQK